MKLTENHTLEQILEFAIVASWQDLTNGAEPELIHIEYNFAGRTLDDLRVWSSVTRDIGFSYVSTGCLLLTPTAAACASTMDTTQKCWPTRLNS
jgi:hypothetical protein